MTRSGEVMFQTPNLASGVRDLLTNDLQKSVESYHRKLTAKQILEAGQLEWRVSRTREDIMRKLVEIGYPMDEK